MTLYTALVNVSKLAAPMIPFMTEEIYQNLVRSVDASAPESVHLCDYPAADEAHIDRGLEAEMEHVLKLVVMGRACRNTANLKNRQPLARMFVKAPFGMPEYFSTIVAEELNVKKVEFTQDVREFTTYTFKPQMRTVGPKYGRLLNQIKQALLEVDGNATMDRLNEEGKISLDIDGNSVILETEDLLIEMSQKPGYVSENNGDVTVVLDSNLTPELVDEGFVRELISKIQTMRKEAGFQVTDHITVYHQGSEKLEQIFAGYEKEICSNVLADKVAAGEPEGYQKDWDINGESVSLGVKR